MQLHVIKYPGMHKYILLLLVFVSCRRQVNSFPVDPGRTDPTIFADTTYFSIQRDTALPQKIVAFAKTQMGVSYKFCSMDPKGGFDCSGFVNYVFDHFKIAVPRSSVEFTNAGTTIELNNCQPGDLILFTGTNSHNRIVGHIGIIVSNDNGDITFIQSTSGKEYGVTISPLDKYYMGRFVKVIRIPA